RAADGFADEHTLVERRAVMGAFRPDGKPVRLDVRQQNRFAKGMAGDELAGPYAAHLHAFGEIRARQLIGVFAHFRWLSRFCDRSRCATNAGATFVTRSLSSAFWIAGSRVLVTASMTAL